MTPSLASLRKEPGQFAWIKRANRSPVRQYFRCSKSDGKDKGNKQQKGLITLGISMRPGTNERSRIVGTPPGKPHRKVIKVYSMLEGQPVPNEESQEDEIASDGKSSLQSSLPLDYSASTNEGNSEHAKAVKNGQAYLASPSDVNKSRTSIRTMLEIVEDRTSQEKSEEELTYIAKKALQQLKNFNVLEILNKGEVACRRIRNLNTKLKEVMKSLGNIVERTIRRSNEDDKNCEVKFATTSLLQTVETQFFNACTLLKVCMKNQLHKFRDDAPFAVRDIVELFRHWLTYKSLKEELVKQNVALSIQCFSANWKHDNLNSLAVVIETVCSVVITQQKHILRKKNFIYNGLELRETPFQSGSRLRLLIETWECLEDMCKIVVQIYSELTEKAHDELIRVLQNAAELITRLLQISQNTLTIIKRNRIINLRPTVLCWKENLSLLCIIDCILPLQTRANNLFNIIEQQCAQPCREYPKLEQIGENIQKSTTLLTQQMMIATCYTRSFKQAEVRHLVSLGQKISTFLRECRNDSLLKNIKEPVRGTSLIRLEQIVQNKIKKLTKEAQSCSDSTHRDIFSCESTVPFDKYSSICSLEVSERIHNRAPSAVRESDSTTYVLKIDTPFANKETGAAIGLNSSIFNQQTDKDCNKQTLTSAPLLNSNDNLSQVDSLDYPLNEEPDDAAVDRYYLAEMTVIKRLGNGSTGTVDLVNYQDQIYALKIPHKTKNRKHKARLSKEAEIFKRMSNHPNILRYYGLCVKSSDSASQTLGIVMEYCDLGTLMSTIQEAKHIKETNDKPHEEWNSVKRIAYRLLTDWNKRLEIALDIVLAVRFLHGKHVVHRDLTSYNVLLSSKGQLCDFQAKVCDFEKANYVVEGEKLSRSMRYPNSPPWSSPEVLIAEPYDVSTDIFSLGTILWELIFLQNPWDILQSRVSRCKILLTQYLIDGHRLPFLDESVPRDLVEYPALRSLVERAWSVDASARPSVDQFHEELKLIQVKMRSRVNDTSLAERSSI